MNIIKQLATSVALLACTWSAAGQEIVEYIHTDALGSPVAVSDATGNVTKRTAYEPYGSTLGAADTDRPGFTRHVSDSQTGLVYMQQRYYDPAIGLFLSADPVGPTQDVSNHFNRFRYANGNPYRYIDPDGRRACGQDWDCRMSQQVGGSDLSRGQMAAVKADPQAYLNRLNERSNRQSSESASARYFANTAMPVTKAAGLEVGADISKVSDNWFTVQNYVLGDPTQGAGAGSVVLGQNNYSGFGARVAIAHTHPVNTAFSYWQGSCWCGGKWEGSLYRGDLQRSLAATGNGPGVNSYVAAPSGAVMGFDFRAMRANQQSNMGSYISAVDYFFEVN